MTVGFPASQSINHTLVSPTEAIKNTLDSKKFGCGTFIDLKSLLVLQNFSTARKSGNIS